MMRLLTRVLVWLLPLLGAYFSALEYFERFPKANLPLWGMTLAIWLFYQPVMNAISGWQRDAIQESWDTQAHTRSGPGLGYHDD